MELASNEHCCDANQLEVRQGLDFLTMKEAVNEVHCRLDGLWHQPELHLDNDKPVDEDLAVFDGELGLPLEVVCLVG